MTRILKVAIAGLLALAVLRPAPEALAANPPAGAPKTTVDFSASDPVIDLKFRLAPYKSPSGEEADRSRWYMIDATNEGVHPVTRVLVAADPPDAALRAIPRHARPEIVQVASSDSGVTVERLRALGRHVFGVTIPPATPVSLAIRVASGDDPPALEAWTMPALVAHNRQFAIFLAAVAGLIGAALAIMAGVGFITAHPAPGWTALVLLLLLLGRLEGAGALDAGWFTALGGPYGLGAMLSGFAFAAAVCLVDLLAPFSDIWPAVVRWRRWVLLVLVALPLLAFVGAPGATVITDAMVVAGTTGIAAYLVHRGLAGSAAARVGAPAAAIFALVAAVMAAIALGALGQFPAASNSVAGFTAAGAVLLALAIAAGEGVAILPIMSTRRVAATNPAASGQSRSLGGRATAAIEAAHQGIFAARYNPDTIRLSPEAAELIGLSGPKTFSQAEWIARIHPDDRETYAAAMAEYRQHAGLAFRMEFRVRHRNGRYPWIELRATTKDDDGAAQCLGLVADITMRKEQEADGPDRFLHDPLTGLGNRIALLDELEQAQERWPTVALAVLDVDRFKAIHASLGDAGGDRFLLAFGARLTRQFEGRAQVFRIGGDSFALLFAANAEEVKSLRTELPAICSDAFAVAGREVFASVSAGVAIGGDAADSPALIRNAEVALRQAKRRGGNTVATFAPDHAAVPETDSVILETELRGALIRHEFAVYYQPIVHLADGCVAGFEALLRWNHPQKGVIPPDDFIAHCEESGLILALGRFVLERTAADLGAWRRQFPQAPVFASVNVSRRQLLDASFESFLSVLLARLPPDSLKLELTERAVEAAADTKLLLERLRAMGAGLALDDFGTGLSSLSQLKDLPIEMLKIDRSFLARRGSSQHDREAAAVMSSMLVLARELNRRAIAEGVETEADAIWLRELGYDLAQGFYLGRPLAADDAVALIARRSEANEHVSEPGVTRLSGTPGVG